MATRDRDRDDEPRGRKRRGGGEDLDFTPVDYDMNDMPVDAAEGEYTGKIKKVTKGKSKKDGFPQLTIEVRLTEAVDEEGEDAVKRGCTLLTYITFFPSSEGRRGIPSKRTLKEIVEAMRLDEDLVPKRIESGRDMDELADALKGGELPVWVVHREDDSGEIRCDMRFKAPKRQGSSKSSRDDDEPRSARNGKGNGHSARARDEDDEPRKGRGRDRDEDADENEDEDRPRVNARGGSDRKSTKDDDKADDRRSTRSRRDEEEDEDKPRARSRGRDDEDEDRPRARARSRD
jgi:hypothetical protein